MRKKITSIFLSLIYCILITIGHSFYRSNSFDYISNHLIKVIIKFIILFIIFYFAFNKIFELLDNLKIKNKNYNNKILLIFDKHPFIFSFISMFICYLIYLIAFYPIVMSNDPSYQILQYFHIDNKYSYYNILLDNNVIITNHHPVLHTLLLGKCASIGREYFNNINIGLFIYTIIQTIILISTLSYTIYYMKNKNIDIRYRFICLLIYSLVPVFPFYALSPVKDVIFGCFVILYIICFYEFINKDKINIKDIIKIILISIMLFLFRNNGIHIFILSFPFLLFLNKKNFKQILLIIIIVFSMFLLYKDIILPHYKITPTSKREALSIPFQQTARYCLTYPSEVTKNEKEAINKILNYDLLKDYNPELSDPIKNQFNKYSTDEDLKNYFKVWYEMGKKHPKTYIESVINNTYGYYYPRKTNWYIYYKYLPILQEHGFDYHYNKLFKLRGLLSFYGHMYQYIPLLGLIVNIGFNTYLLIFMLLYLIYNKKYKDMFYLLPSFLILLVCIASPANTYFRYALPNIFAMPLLISIFININKK